MSADPQDSDLRDYLLVLWRRKYLVALLLVATVAGALIPALRQEPVYEGTASLLLERRSTEDLFDSGRGIVVGDPARAARTEIDVIQSQRIRRLVTKEIGAAPSVSVTAVVQKDILQIRAESNDPRQAARIANAYARTYISYKRTQAVEDLLVAANEVNTKVIDLQEQIDALDREIGALPPPQQGPLNATRDALLSQQTLFKQKLGQLQVDAALKTGGAQILDDAVEPVSPVRPRPLRSAIFGAVLGLLLGVGAALLIEFIDDSIRDREDLAAASGLSVLGTIPNLRSWRDRREAHVISLESPTSLPAEAYRTLRTAVQFLTLDKPAHSIQITSPTAAEGKTTTISNLAVVLAKAGQRVILLDCDLRRPRVHSFFSLPNTVGFTSIVVGDATVAEAAQAVPGVGWLRVITSGPLPPNPSELLFSARARNVIEALKQEDAIILIDTPPVLPVTDSTVVAKSVDATVLIVNGRSTSKRQMRRAIEILTQVQAPLIGTVLNQAPQGGGAGDEYSYQYYAPDDAGSRGRRGWSRWRFPRRGGGTPETPVAAGTPRTG